MPKVPVGYRGLSPEDRRKVDELEKQCNEILDQLFDDPGNEGLSRTLREIEVKIVTLTGETAMDYTLTSFSNR